MEYQVTKSQYISSHCFVCGTDNECSLGAQFLETDTGELVGVFHAHEGHQSYPGRVHGGVSAAMLDEIMGRAINVTEPDAWSVTAELNTRYRKPLPYDKPVTARARVTKNSSRVYEASGEIVLEDGTVAVEATGRYVKLPLESIAPEGFDVDGESAIYEDTRPLPSTIALGD